MSVIGRPKGTGGKYTVNPDKIRTRKSGLKYDKPAKILTSEEIERKKEYKRLYAMASYIRKKHKKAVLKATIEEKQNLKDKILTTINNKLENMSKDELETIINIMPNDLTIFTNLL
jgi:hypothetical protein